MNNEVNAWVKKTATVRNTLKSVNTTMTKVKSSLKNMAVLRKLTKLCPEVGNDTRWTGHGRMMRKYQRTRSDLVVAHDADETNFPMNKSTAFKRSADKVSGCFQDTNVVAVSMQTHLYKLKQCRGDLDALLSECNAGHVDSNSVWYNRKLAGTYIKRRSSKLPDPDFVEGIIKIQEGKVLELTEAEKDACVRVLNHQQDPDMTEATEQGENSSFASRFRDKIKKRKAGVLEKTQASPYINVDYICGSAAEVERLWSLCKYILTNTRSRMTPNLFEALVFLKVNHDHWDASSVQLAYTHATKDSQSEKVGTMINEDDEYAADLDEDE